MSSEIAIKVNGLSKCYQIYEKPRDRLLQMLYRGARQFFREFWALRDVSFEVKRGETVGIIGRNGSGKSTLLQLICGTLNPTSGSLDTKGRIAALLELGSGFNTEFTGKENVYMNASILGLSSAEIDSSYDDIAAFADIGAFIDQPVKTYSSGMTVRLAFAVQAMVNPDIFVVDEALAVGDEKFQRKCFSRIEALREQGTAILFVSHVGAQVMELCDRAILLEAGEKIVESEPLRVVRSYQRLIYAPEGEREGLLHQLRNPEAVTVTAAGSSNSDGAPDSPPPPSDFFDPGLVPVTTVVYPVQGAEIARFEIQDMEGRVVNVLRSRAPYRIVLHGRFLASLERVHFGVHIRSTSGAGISGQRYPEEGQYIDVVQAETTFSVTFSFNMMLQAGVYFSGGGVWVTHPEPGCAHRILDAVMFRVQSDGPQHSFGYCDLSASPPSVILGMK